MTRYANLGSDPSFSEPYEDFLRTHVEPGVTKGLLHTVSLLDLRDIASGGKKAENPGMTDPSRHAIREHYPTMAEFAQKAGVKELFFTQEGTWIIPPKMRNQFPKYKEYLLSDYNNGQSAGTASITFAQNQPIPIFKDGEQLGGFENGDFHGFLTITDFRTGKSHELHQTFLENSYDPALRPGIVGVNTALAQRQGLTAEQLNALVKDEKIELDTTGMLGGREGGNRQTGLASYQCELIPDPDKAFNWNDGIKGANFNYVPLAAIEYKLTEQQLNAMLFDRELAARECSIKAAPGSTAKQNEVGYIPATREAFYPDGTPRYVMVEKKMVDGEQEIFFWNASPDKSGKVPDGAIRVKEYDTVVDPKDMQVVKPYNHFGGSNAAGFQGTDNCFSATAGMLDNVAANGRVDRGVLQTLGIKAFRESSIQRLLIALALKGSLGGHETKTIANGPLQGEIDLFHNGKATLYDFCGIRSVLATGAKQAVKNIAATIVAEIRQEEEIKLGGIAGKAIEQITQQRQTALAKMERPPEEQLLLLPTGTTGQALLQINTDDVTAKAANRNSLVQGSLLHFRK